MRILLALFSFSALALGGCADGLTGPESDLVSAPTQRAVDAPESAEPSLYTTWTGEDEKAFYVLTFAANSLSPSDSKDAFSGAGMCHLSGNDVIVGDPACYIADSAIRGNVLDFAIVDATGEVIAKANGETDDEFTVLKLNLVYDDGTVTIVEFARPSMGR